MEVDPSSRTTATRTIEEAKRLHEWIDEPNLYVKIPATEPGRRRDRGLHRATARDINVTLIFSLQRYGEVIEAYIRGLERLVAGGGDPSKVRSVASFFVSRVDTEADKRLDAIGSTRARRGKLAIANAKLAYQHYQERVLRRALGGARRARARTPQRCLWASTSTKNPDYRDVMYVEELIGPDTVNTMPEETIDAFQDHGEVAATRSSEGVDEARAAARRARARPASTTTTSTETLEREGVQKFADSFDELLEGIAREARRARRRVTDHRRELVERIWARDPTRLDRRRRGAAGSAGSTSRGACASSVDELLEFADDVARRRRSTTSSLLGMGGSSLAPEVLRRTFGVERFHVLDTTHPKAIRALEATLDLERHALRLGLEVGLDARDALAHRLLLERAASGDRFVAITDPGLGARAARARARVPARLPRRADDRRPLLGALAVRDRARRR